MRIHAINGLNYILPADNRKKTTIIQNNYLNDSFQKQNIYNAVSFTGVDGKGRVKQRGMLFHISSLPATRSYCGQFLDKQTDEFIEFLQKSHQTHWIMNPLFALGNDLCPYNASGRFSKNKYLINLNELTKSKYGNLLKESELPDDITAPLFTMDMLKRQKDPRFAKAYSRFEKLDSTHPLKVEYKKFEKENDELWLNKYAAYDALSEKYGTNWKKWPKDIQMLPEKVKDGDTTFEEYFKGKDSDNFKRYKFEQFLYDKQFTEFNNQLKSKGIRLILDLAIGVDPNGVDTWANKDIFLLDKNFNPTKVSGCPPEAAYPYTQVWNHALYNYDSPEFWTYQENSLKKLLKEGDLRLDHFVGYINRAEIPTKYETPDGRILKDSEIFAPKENGGMGKDFFKPDWIVRIDKKTNSRGENMFELFKRVAKEQGLNPSDCYILEDFGPLAETEAYKEFKKDFAEDFVSQRIPIAMGIGENINKPQDKTNISNPKNLADQKNIALLTGNHDLPPLREYVDLLLDNKPKNLNGDNSPMLFRKFCKEELHLTDEELKNRDVVMRELMKWHYTRENVKQVQTTLQDALGLYFRPNIPGFWNGMEDKYKMKTTAEALLPFWSRVFPKDFLSRTEKTGINPGYKDLADDYIKMMDDLFEKSNTTC